VGKLISPDPDMWGNPVRKGALENRVRERKETVRHDRKRLVLTVAITAILLAPFVIVATRFFFR
jgi:uncharacterized sodium:solute symporter family permease YidK